MHDILLAALPVFVLMMGLEWAWGRHRGRDTYRLADTVSSLSQGLLSQALGVVTQLFQIGLYAWALPHLNLLPGASLWQTPLGWVLAVVLYDFCDYWLHRASHENALLWAAHVVHHQSEHFNFSTALRQEPLYAVLGWVFYLPMAVLGVPVEQYAVAGLVVLLYQFWIHTEHIGRLGWMDRVFSTPSNHRVHHAVNPVYLDRNYGAILVVWDRLFGSFAEEREACVYGTVKPLASWDPLWAVAHFYIELGQRMRTTPRWSDRLRVLWKGPGWMPPGFEAAPPPLTRVRFDPPLTASQRAAATALFLGLAGAVGVMIWRADELPFTRELAATAAFCVGLWLSGAVLGGRVRPWAGMVGGVAAAGVSIAILL